VRFRPPADEDALTPVVAAYKVAGRAAADLAKQLIVDCCDEILRRAPRRASSSRATPKAAAALRRRRRPVGQERQDRARLRRRAVPPQQQPLAHIGHADLLVDWLQGLDAEIAARAAGESGGGAAS
jgi:hypothetical protein